MVLSPGKGRLMADKTEMFLFASSVDYLNHSISAKGLQLTKEKFTSLQLASINS